MSRIFLLGLLLSLGVARTWALDVSYLGVIKSIRYEQTSGGLTVLASNGYTFTAFAYSTNGQVTNITVKPPNSTPTRSLAADTNRLVWQFEEQFHTVAALDAAYPSSSSLNPFATFSYVMNVGGINDGLRSATPKFVTLGGSPGLPQITNYAAAQAIDTTGDFTLRFFPSGGAFDLVQLTILNAASNAVFATPLPFTDGAVSGTASEVLIPANVLPPGQTLTGYLTFARPHLPDTNSYPGVVAVPAIARDTEFPLVTRPAPPRPVLVAQPGLPFRLTFTGETNRLYRLQATTNWTAWETLQTTNLTTPQATFTDPASVGLPRRFYRLQIGP